jgi:hypothetical protein
MISGSLKNGLSTSGPPVKSRVLPSLFSTDFLRVLAGALSGYVLLAGVMVLAGWIFNIERLTAWTNDGISMFPNTAIAAVCLGAAMLLLLSPPARARTIACCAFAGLAAVIGGATLFEHLSGLNLGIDTLLFAPHFGQRAAASPMRMGPPASVSYLLLGTAICFSTQPGPGRRIAVGTAAFTFFIALLSLTGYLFGADTLFGVARFTGRSFPTTGSSPRS